MKLHLTPRLAAVAGAVPPGGRRADVGTDHAYLPTWLVLEGKSPRALAADLRPGPLARAAETVKAFGVEDRVELRLGNGLEPVEPGEADAVAIAGMGGETILEILAAAPWAAEKVCIVQPMTSVEDLRRRLPTIGMQVAGEQIAREGKTLYIIMTLAGGRGKPLTAGECWVGQPEHHAGDPLWPDYLTQELGRVRRALGGLRRSGKPEDQARRLELERVEGELSALSRG